MQNKLVTYKSAHVKQKMPKLAKQHNLVIDTLELALRPKIEISDFFFLTKFYFRF